MLYNKVSERNVLAGKHLQSKRLVNDPFSVSFGSLSILEELNLQLNQIDSLPDCVRSLKWPRKLDLSDCPRLKVVCAPRTLEGLNVLGCDSLEKVTVASPITYVLFCDSKTLIEVEGRLSKLDTSEIDEKILYRLGWIKRQQMIDDKFPRMSDLLNPQGNILHIHVIFWR